MNVMQGKSSPDGLKSPVADPISGFLAVYGNDKSFSHEVEMFNALSRASAIIYVVDGSRPWCSNEDGREMEILKWTCIPCLVVINNKKGYEKFIDKWQKQAKKVFGKFVMFNAWDADFSNRLHLFENLLEIDSAHAEKIETVIKELKAHHQARIEKCATIFLELIRTVLTIEKQKKVTCNVNIYNELEGLQDLFQKDVMAYERAALNKARKVFKHNCFEFSMPDHSSKRQKFLASKTKKCGLTKENILRVTIGLLVVALVDMLTIQLVAPGIWAIACGLGAAMYWGGSITRRPVLGKNLEWRELTVKASEAPQLMFHLIDRFICACHVYSKRAHAQRDINGETEQLYCPEYADFKTGLWSKKDLSTASELYKAMLKGEAERIEEARYQFKAVLKKKLSDSIG